MLMMFLVSMTSEEVGWRSRVIGGAVGGVAGCTLAYPLKGPCTKWRQGGEFDPDHTIHHGTIGTSVAMLGGPVSNRVPTYGPVIAGFGAGMAVEDYAHHAGLVGWPKAELFDFAADEGGDSLVSEQPARAETVNILASSGGRNFEHDR